MTHQQLCGSVRVGVDVLGHVGNVDIEDNGSGAVIDAAHLSDASNLSDAGNVSDTSDIGDVEGDVEGDIGVDGIVGDISNDSPVVVAPEIGDVAIGTEVSDLVDNATSDTLNVDGMVDDITSGIDADLTGILGN